MCGFGGRCWTKSHLFFSGGGRGIVERRTAVRRFICSPFRNQLHVTLSPSSNTRPLLPNIFPSKIFRSYLVSRVDVVVIFVTRMSGWVFATRTHERTSFPPSRDDLMCVCFFFSHFFCVCFGHDDVSRFSFSAAPLYIYILFLYCCSCCCVYCCFALWRAAPARCSGNDGGGATRLVTRFQHTFARHI